MQLLRAEYVARVRYAVKPVAVVEYLKLKIQLTIMVVQLDS